ncbi:hypothetical protein JCM10207_008188 [Rhodosporidiobolus poonsookiae]
MAYLTPPRSTSPEAHYSLPSAADEAAASVFLPHHHSSTSRRPSFSLPEREAKRPRSRTASVAPHQHAQQVQQPEQPQSLHQWLSAPHSHPPSPALTPEGAAPAHVPERTFVRRDDLTARAVQRAQEMCAAPSQQVLNETGLASEKDKFVNGLVGAAVLAIESIWGTSASNSPPAAGVLPLQYFVREVLRRSRTSCSTLQLALYYLHKSRREIREAVARADGARGEMVRLEEQIKAVKRSAGPTHHAYPSPPHSPADVDAALDGTTEETVASFAALGQRFTSLVEAQNSPVLCGRRCFLAALILAAKFLSDRCFSARAWSKISGLSTLEVNRAEKELLKTMKYELFVGAEGFRRWTERLSTLTTPPASPVPAAPLALASAPALSPAALARHGLARSSSEYIAPAPLPVPLPSSAVAHAPPMARRQLSRGATLPTLGTSRATGFPVAVAQPRAAPVSMDVDAGVPTSARKLRALPARAYGGQLGGGGGAFGAPVAVAVAVKAH